MVVSWSRRLWRSKVWRWRYRSLSTGGPPEDKLRVIPFKRSVKEAKAMYERYHILSYAPDVQQRFIPFWAVSATAQVSVLSASLGFDKVRYIYDPKVGWHRRVDREYRTVSWSYREAPRWERNHDPGNDYGMQMYASVDYRRRYVEGIRSLSMFDGAQKLPLDDRMEEFKMPPATALEAARSAIVSTATSDASKLLRQRYLADDVRFIDLDVKLERVGIAPVYVPVYIFESNYLGEKLRTFVHGATLAVGGQRLTTTQPLAGVLAASAFLIMAGTSSATASSGVMAVLLPALVFGVAAALYPALELKIREWWRAREASRVTSGPWNASYIKAFEDLDNEWMRRKAEAEKADAEWREKVEQWVRDAQKGQTEWERWFRSYYGGNQGQQQQRQRYQQYQQQQQQQHQRYQQYQQPRADPQGYYAKLGLKPGASQDEVKSAFRSMAVKHHPDKFSDPKEKEAAKSRFQEISAAYQVLRDPSKKQVYDQTGWT